MSKKQLLSFIACGLAVFVMSFGAVVALLPNEAHAEKVLSSIDYNMIAKKTQAQALHSCLTGASVWGGKLADYKGSIFTASSTDKAQFLWYGQSGSNYQFNRADGNCNSLFGGGYPTEFTVNAPAKNSSELAQKLEEIGYKKSGESYYIDSAKALQYFTGYNGNTMLFDEKEAMQVIAFYIDSNSPIGYGGFDYYDNDASKACDVAGSSKASDAATAAADSGAEYTWLNVSTTKRCAVKAKSPSSGVMVYTVNSGRYNDAAGTQKTFKDLVTQWNVYIDYMWTDPEGQEGDDLISGDTIDPTTGEAQGNLTASEDPCFNAGATLGWIICPVLDIAGKAATGIYEHVVEPFLEVKAEWLGQGTNSVYSGWTQFRDFANIIFVIAFIVVVLAQVTGIGISNYGIKKILPRLIMIVVLVNASYILCQLATDISNILGSSLQELFVNMAKGVGAPSGIGETVGVYGDSSKQATWFSFSGIASTILTIIIGGGAAWGLAVTWEVWLIPLLLTILGCGVGILFFFIILGVRQAGILILTALAPVAIVCYALPNTKSYFDKWRKMYVGLLVVYPICGALIGGGQFASALLINAGGGSNFFYDLVAMLVQIVPFFFIPSILKSSMAAMGNLGLKIAGIGDRVGRFAKSTAGNARPVKEKQQEWLRNNNQRRDSRLAVRLKKAAEKTRTELDRYETRLKTAGVDLNDDKAIRRYLGDEYGKYRSTKNRAAARTYRANQARKRYEGSVMEDAMAEANARRDLLTPGSARYDKIIGGAMREQRNKDDAGQVAMYEDGRVEAFNGSGRIVRGDSLTDLKQEHLDLLQHVADNPTDEAAASKLRAVETMLGKMGPNGFDAMEDNFGNLMANHAQFDDTNSDGLRIAASHLSRNFAGQIKAGSRTFDAMLNDINKGGTLANQGTFSQQTFSDLKGGTVQRYVSSHYGSKGAQSIKAENVNDLGDAYYDNLLRATINNDLKGADLEQVLKVFNEAETLAAQGKLSLKGEVQQRIKAIRDVAYANGSVLGGNTRSEGSRMIGVASSAGIDSIVKQIASAGNWSTMTVSEKKTYSDLVNNISDSLQHDAHTVENVRQLQNALADARTKGIETAVTGGTLVNKVNSANLHAFKIPRGSKQKVTMPTGWTLTAGGNWIDITTGMPLSAADALKAKQILKHNNKIDIENDGT